MTIITQEEVLKIAQIAKIAVDSKEIEPLTQQLHDVLSYAACVKKVAQELEEQEPSNKNVNFFRQDLVVACDAQAVLNQAPEREADYFVVPKILDTK